MDFHFYRVSSSVYVIEVSCEWSLRNTKTQPDRCDKAIRASFSMWTVRRDALEFDFTINRWVVCLCNGTKDLGWNCRQCLPFSSNCNCVFTYSVGNVMQISMPPVIPPATIPFSPVAPPAAAAAPLFSIHGRLMNGLTFGIGGKRLESIFLLLCYSLM